MRLIIENTPQQVAQWAANYIIAQIKNKEQHTSSPFVLGLPTGYSSGHFKKDESYKL